MRFEWKVIKRHIFQESEDDVDKDDFKDILLWIVGLRKFELSPLGEFELAPSSSNLLILLTSPIRMFSILLVLSLSWLCTIITLPFVAMSAIKFGKEGE